MSSHRNRGASRAMALFCGLSASLATTLVIAQEKAPDDKLMDEVVVTGSRIARPNAESSVPVTTVSGEELCQSGSTSVGLSPMVREQFASVRILYARSGPQPVPL